MNLHPAQFEAGNTSTDNAPATDANANCVVVYDQGDS
jgi:hypothetical protein